MVFDKGRPTCPGDHRFVGSGCALWDNVGNRFTLLLFFLALVGSNQEDKEASFK